MFVTSETLEISVFVNKQRKIFTCELYIPSWSEWTRPAKWALPCV